MEEFICLVESFFDMESQKLYQIEYEDEEIKEQTELNSIMIKIRFGYENFFEIEVPITPPNEDEQCEIIDSER